MRKMIAVILALCMLATLSACRQVKDRVLTPVDGKSDANGSVIDETHENPDDATHHSADEENSQLPSARSEDVELYVFVGPAGDSYVVNKYGETASGYSVNARGDILDENSRIVVAAKNAARFYSITTLEFEKNNYAVFLDAREEFVDNDIYVTRVNQYAVNAAITLSCKPSDATNQVILLSSSNRDVLEIRANSNAKILADGEFEVEPGQIAIKPQEPGAPIRIMITAKQPGEAKLVSEALVGGAVAECSFSVHAGSVESDTAPAEELPDYINSSGNNYSHVHTFRATVVEPTEWEKGYTLYVCSECGYSYKDHYTSKLSPSETKAPDHVHNYTASVVAPTETERGYTLYVCSECGDSYKENFVNPTGA